MSKNTFEEAEDFLMHWGILGMKWGVRRYQNPDGSLTAAGKKRYGADDAKESSSRKSSNKSSEAQSQEDSQPQARANTPKPASEMTDDEIRAFLNRVELERKYNAIVNPPPPQQEQKKKEMSGTLKFMKDVFAESAKTVAKTVITAKLMELVGGNKKKDTSDKTDNIKKLFNDMNKENSDRFKRIEGLLESGNNKNNKNNNNNNNNNNNKNNNRDDQSQNNMMNQLTNYYAQQEAYRQAAQRQRQADAIAQRQAYEANERAMREARAEQQRALKEAKINQRNYEKEKREYEKGLKRYEREEKKRQDEENKKKAAASSRTIEERVANLNSRTIEQRVASLLGSKEIRDAKASSLPKEDYSVFDEELWKDLTSGW